MAKLPEMFRPILWSYDFEKCDPEKMRGTIIKQTIQYGNLKHLRWALAFYGLDIIKDVLEKAKKTEIREKSMNLARLLLS